VRALLNLKKEDHRVRQDQKPVDPRGVSGPEIGAQGNHLFGRLSRLL
jgi:hypothetical protein